MDALTISGRISRGFIDGNESAVKAWMKAAEGKWGSVTYKIGRPKASHAQFKWYRGIALPMLAEFLGYDRDERDELHDSLLGTCYGWKKDKLTGREVPAHRTRENDTKEMAEFSDWLKRWAAKTHGVVIPDPIRRAA